MSAPNWLVLDVYANGAETPTVVDVKPRTVLAWEREKPTRSAIQLQDDALRLTYLYELAWIALGKPGGDFAAWSDATDVIRHQDSPTDDATEDAAPGPTDATPPTTS